jgi:hypothetical protein
VLKRSPLLAFLLLGCVHAKPGGNPEMVKPQVESFHQRIRWADWRGASELIVPERREAFLRARKAENDGKDLQIADYQLEDFKLPDAFHARVASSLSWVKLPSSSLATKTMESEWVWRDGNWFIARVTDGPFGELSAPYSWEPPDAGE